MSNLSNQLCMMCHQKNRLAALEQLKMIKREINRSPKFKTITIEYPVKSLMWHINAHCRYGISCQKLKSMQNEALRLARDLEPQLIAIAKNGDKALYRNILRLLGGHFPAVYRELEHIHYESHK